MHLFDSLCARRRKVNKESLSLPSLFTDYDRFNVGDITEAGMERALGGACLLPAEPVFRAIVKKFREHSMRSSGGEVNYRAFLAAVSHCSKENPNCSTTLHVSFVQDHCLVGKNPVFPRHGASSVGRPYCKRRHQVNKLV